MDVLSKIIKHCRRFTHPGVTTSTSLLAQEIIDICREAMNDNDMETQDENDEQLRDIHRTQV